MTVTSKMVNAAIAAVYAEDWASITYILGKGWLNIAPTYVIEAWRWRGHGPRGISDLVEAFAKWEDSLTVKSKKFAVKDVQQIIDSLASCNDELENALSCVHHYKDNKQIMNQIDRLSRNYVALAARITK